MRTYTCIQNTKRKVTFNFEDTHNEGQVFCIPLRSSVGDIITCDCPLPSTSITDVVAIVTTSLITWIESVDQYTNSTRKLSSDVCTIKLLKR